MPLWILGHWTLIPSHSPDVFDHPLELPPGDQRKLVSPDNQAILPSQRRALCQRAFPTASIAVCLTFNHSYGRREQLNIRLEVPWVESKSALYQALKGHEIGPVVHGHLTEHRFSLERMEGVHGNNGNLGVYQAVVEHLHSFDPCRL